MLPGDPGHTFRAESGRLGDPLPFPEADRLSLLVGDDLAQSVRFGDVLD
jgi:hypothetical protein